MIYTILKDNHFSFPRTNIIPTFDKTFEYSWVFNKSVIQKLENNQWNKLFGIWFIPPISKWWEFRFKPTRYNAAMVAFRWNNGLELSPYLHRQGSADRADSNYKGVNLNCIKKCKIGDVIHTKIVFNKDTVEITIDNQVYKFDFESSLVGFRIQPYFGGLKPSKNNLTILKLN